MKIQTHTAEGNTVVWFLNSRNCAEVANVSKGHFGWEMTFKGKTIQGYVNKTQAVADAKKALKKFYLNGGR